MENYFSTALDWALNVKDDVLDWDFSEETPQDVFIQKFSAANRAATIIDGAAAAMDNEVIVNDPTNDKLWSKSTNLRLYAVALRKRAEVIKDACSELYS
jgi:hypothetical protein